MVENTPQELAKHFGPPPACLAWCLRRSVAGSQVRDLIALFPADGDFGGESHAQPRDIVAALGPEI